MKLLKKLKNFYISKRIKKCGKDVSFGNNILITNYDKLELGEHIAIGPNNIFYAAIQPVKMGNYIMTGPNVTFITGNHRTDVIGEYMFNVKEKKPENDAAIVIEDDVWIGANVTILKGVKIGTGSIIGAGSIVFKSVPPYTIVYSNGKQKKRFSEQDIQKHQGLLHQ